MIQHLTTELLEDYLRHLCQGTSEENERRLLPRTREAVSGYMRSLPAGSPVRPLLLDRLTIGMSQEDLTALVTDLADTLDPRELSILISRQTSPAHQPAPTAPGSTISESPTTASNGRVSGRRHAPLPDTRHRLQAAAHKRS